MSKTKAMWLTRSSGYTNPMYSIWAGGSHPEITKGLWQASDGKPFYCFCATSFGALTGVKLRPGTKKKIRIVEV